MSESLPGFGRLFSILIKKRLLTPAQAEQLTEQSARLGLPLFELLPRVGRLGMLVEEEMISIVAQEMNIPPVALDRIAPELAALKGMPLEALRYRDLFPFARIGSILSIAIVNPFDILSLDDVRGETRCDVRPVVASKRAMQAAWRRFEPMEEELERPAAMPGEEAVAEELTRHGFLPIIDASRYATPSTVTRWLSLDEMARWELVILDRVGDTILVAVTRRDGLDQVLCRIEEHGSIRLFVTRRSQQREALSRLRQRIAEADS